MLSSFSGVKQELMISFDLICQQVLNKLVEMISEPAAMNKVERYPTRQSRWDIPGTLPNMETAATSQSDVTVKVADVEMSESPNCDKIDTSASSEAAPVQEFVAALKTATKKVDQRKAQVRTKNLFLFEQLTYNKHDIKQKNY